MSDVTASTTGDGRSAGSRRQARPVESDYRGHRIEVAARHVEGEWDAEARILRTLSEAKPQVERITCRKSSAKVAEERAAIYARRWVGRYGAA